MSTEISIEHEYLEKHFYKEFGRLCATVFYIIILLTMPF